MSCPVKWRNLHKQEVNAPCTLILLIVTHSPKVPAGSGAWRRRAGRLPRGAGGVAPQPRSAPCALILVAGSAAEEKGRGLETRGRGLEASSVLGPRRRHVPCSGGSRQNGVCGKFRGPSAGRDSLRAVPSGTVGGEGVAEGQGASSRKRSQRGGPHLNHPEPGPLPAPSCALVLI